MTHCYYLQLSKSAFAEIIFANEILKCSKSSHLRVHRGAYIPALYIRPVVNPSGLCGLNFKAQNYHKFI